MIRFYAPDIDTMQALPEAESAHAVRVLRKKAGDEIEAVDGKGYIYRCRLITDHPKSAAVEIIERIAAPKVWKPEICLAVAPTKNNDRMEWLVEKAVEIGIDSFVPILTSRSERRQIKTERLEKIAVSAMKQSLKAILPTIHPMTPLKDFLKGISPQAQKFVGWCDSESDRRLLAKACSPATDTTILIGPEGDFTPEEIDACLTAGFTAVTMGDNRLRTETAALVGVDTVHIINQAFS